jgi:D-lactate dehydrogenase
MPLLLQPDTNRIAPPPHLPTSDCVPAELLRGTPAGLRDDLAAIVGAAEVHGRLTDLVRYATDASPYRLFPKAIVTPHTLDEVARLLAYARASKLYVTIRAAGSSLSGQAQGDGIMIDARKHWAGVTVEEAGAKLRARPGTVMFRANLALAPYGTRLGPDPASYSVATVGGVIANNSSGMCCGTAQNSYQTLESLRFLLPSGTVVDSAAANAEAQFAAAEPALAAGLLAIREEILADAELVARLRKKYSIKNTTGYHMAAFLDASTPLEIFRRLLVGSEGTLAFLAEAVFRTVPDDKHRLTSFMIFPDMHAACAAVAPFIAAGAAAAEITDRACLRSVEGRPGVPPHWRDLPQDATGLLIEFREPSAVRLAEAALAAHEVLQSLALYEPASFTTDPTVAAQYWSVRSGLLASIGGVRPSGTSLILEDVCFPTDRLAEGALDLQQLFARHGYAGAVFGHASAGNLHFLITPSLNVPAEIARFDGFLRDVVQLVTLKYDGSLKAEHGTGRNIAPFVEQEWGAKLTAMMWRVKHLADPDLVLAPGVLLTRDPQSHLRNLHTVPTVESEVDRCIECGYCEPVCPSRDLTTTPRQRIALRREMLRQPTGSAIAKQLLEEYEYDAIETCAGDGSCAIACPVDIDTGALMKHFRQQQHTNGQESAGRYAAEHWDVAEAAARGALRINHVAATLPGGNFLAASLLGAARKVVSRDLVPAHLPNIPVQASSRLPVSSREEASAVYFHACVNRMFGDAEMSDDANLTLPEAMLAVSARAGLPLWIPADLPGTCCGTVWHSKGYEEGNRTMANLVVEKMWKWSGEGRLPVVCDASSCTLGLTAEVLPYLTEENALHHAALTIYDSITWAHDHLLPRLSVARRVSSVAVHPVCSVQTLGLTKSLQSLAGALADKAVTPIHATCCGFAGDRGFLHPELTKSATAEEAAELSSQTHEAYVCSNRTCEIGLNLATDKPFRSIVFLLEELSRPVTTT